MNSLYHTIVMACCSLGLCALTHCGGSKAGDDLAPSNLRGTTLSIDVGIIQNDSNFPSIFELITGTDGSNMLTTRNQTIQLWQGYNIQVLYVKKDSNSAQLSLVWIQAPAGSTTTRMSVSIENMVFDSTDHATAVGGASLSYQYGADPVTNLPDAPADITVFYNNN